MSAWSSVRSWLGRGDTRAGVASRLGPRRAVRADASGPCSKNWKAERHPALLRVGVAQSPLSLLGSASPSGGGLARTNPVPAMTSTVSAAAPSVTPASSQTVQVKAAAPVQSGATSQTPPSVAAPLVPDPLAVGDFTDDSSSAGPALRAGVQAAAAAVTGAPESSGVPVAPPNGVGQTPQAQTDGAGSTNAATPAGTIAPTTIRPDSGIDGSQPLLDLAYGLPYGTPVAMGANAVAPTRGTAGPSDFSFLEFNGQSVLVNVHSTQTANLDTLQKNLQTQLGFTTVSTFASQNMVTGFLPVNQILNLPNIADFDSVTPVYKPELNVGSYPTDGDPVIHSDTFRTANNVDGTGVKVGVMSDSANEVGGGLAASEASGDVAPNVQLLADDPLPGPTDEGRAMLEIVHHIAPGASEAFNTANGAGAAGMATGIQNLVNAGAKVITDDVTYPDEPMFNDGLIAQAAESAVNQGVFYTTSAGNNANHGYLANWSGVTATVGGVTGTFQDIAGGSALQTFTLGVGDTVTLAFDWDSAFLEGGGTGNYTVPNDLQVLVTNANGTVLSTPQVFISNGTSTNEAFQFVQFTNTAAFNTTNFAFSFNLVSGPAPTMIRWVSLDDGDPTADPHALMEGAPTSFGHATATGVVTTAAANFQTPTTPEPYSALGGNIPILFDNTGARLATPDIRVEPVVTAPDGVQTSFFSPPAVGGIFQFFGTSAATPHVAAAAALLMQQAPTATVAEVTQYLEQNALDINTPGRDSLTGFGLIQLTVPLVVATPTGPEASLFPDDRFEQNETSDRATQFGVLAAGTTTYDDLTINIHANGLPDYDWYRWTAGQAGTFTATETNTQGGNLELHLFTLQGNTLVDLADSLGSGTTPQTLSTSLADGQVIFVEIKGNNDSFRHKTQAEYSLAVTLA